MSVKDGFCCRHLSGVCTRLNHEQILGCCHSSELQCCAKRNQGQQDGCNYFARCGSPLLMRNDVLKLDGAYKGAGTEHGTAVRCRV